MEKDLTLLHREGLTAAVDANAIDERLVVTPLLDRERQIGESSIDLRLGTEFRAFRRTQRPGLDPGFQPQAVVKATEEAIAIEIGEPLWLHPNQFILGATLEFLRVPSHLGAYVLGRSTWGRAGLLVATAIMVGPGFAGNLTLELVNHGESPIALYPGSRIAQLAVHSLPGATESPYGSTQDKYIGPTGPESPRFDGDQEEIERLRAVGKQLHDLDSGSA
jgi:dCTP deaminase